MMDELQADLMQAIRAYVATSPLGRLRDIDGAPMWDEPLVGFADGDDPLFDLYRSAVAPDHMTPREALAQLGEGGAAAWPRVGVVAWILPVAAPTRLSNGEMTEGPSPRWHQTRGQGEAFNESLRRHVVGLLADRGLAAVAPALSAGFRWTSGPWGLASTWSERHAAYAAGLGTFGLSDGLITARGIAHRCGSVVVGTGWPASPRPYTGSHEYCLYRRDGSCGECMARCPGRAIGPAGHDKDRCRAYIRAMQAEWRRRPGYGGDYMACGLCQTGVPCEAGIP